MVSEAYALALHRVRAAQDGSGNIDAKELKALMESVGKVVTEEEVAEMVLMADSDGSGEIDFAEFVTLMVHKAADDASHDTLKAAFTVFDPEGIGVIPKEEMRTIMLNVGEPVRLAPHDPAERTALRRLRTAYAHTCAHADGTPVRTRPILEGDFRSSRTATAEARCGRRRLRRLRGGHQRPPDPVAKSRSTVDGCRLDMTRKARISAICKAEHMADARCKLR